MDVLSEQTCVIGKIFQDVSISIDNQVFIMIKTGKWAWMAFEILSSLLHIFCFGEAKGFWAPRKDIVLKTLRSAGMSEQKLQSAVIEVGRPSWTQLAAQIWK